MENLEVIPPETGIRNIKELNKEVVRSYEIPSFRFGKQRKMRIKDCDVYVMKKIGRRWKHSLSGCHLSVESKTGEIKAIEYSLDLANENVYVDGMSKWVGNPSYKNFLRSKLDPTIPNNWDELHRQKTFTFLVANTYYEEVSSHGMSEKEARRKLIDADNTLNEEGWKLATPNRPFPPRKTLEHMLEMDGKNMVGLRMDYPFEERRLRKQGILG